MPAVTMRELLEAGVHFGHQTRRWNPKMRRFIFSERSGIYVIDLQQTIELIETAHSFVRNVAERGGSVLFVGTKKQAQDSIRDEATRVGMPFVNHRWLGGLLTNHRTIQSRITRMHDLRRLRADGQLDLLPPKERMSVLRELEKLEINLGGVADMRRLPQAVFVLDLKKEALAIREARRCNIPVIGLVDTNCDPDEADLRDPGQRRRDPLVRHRDPRDRRRHRRGPGRRARRRRRDRRGRRGRGARRRGGRRRSRRRGRGRCSRGRRRRARYRVGRRGADRVRGLTEPPPGDLP